MQEIEVQLEHPELPVTLEAPEVTDFLVFPDELEHRDLMVLMEILEQMEEPELLVQLDPTEHVAQLVLRDQQGAEDPLDHKVKTEHPEATEETEIKELKDQLVQQELPVLTA